MIHLEMKNNPSAVACLARAGVSNVHLFYVCAWMQKQQFVDVATGSLGQGLGAACGMAYTGKFFDKAR